MICGRHNRSCSSRRPRLSDSRRRCLQRGSSSVLERSSHRRRGGRHDYGRTRRLRRGSSRRSCHDRRSDDRRKRRRANRCRKRLNRARVVRRSLAIADIRLPKVGALAIRRTPATSKQDGKLSMAISGAMRGETRRSLARMLTLVANRAYIGARAARASSAMNATVRARARSRLFVTRSYNDAGDDTRGAFDDVAGRRSAARGAKREQTFISLSIRTTTTNRIVRARSHLRRRRRKKTIVTIDCMRSLARNDERRCAYELEMRRARLGASRRFSPLLVQLVWRRRRRLVQQ